MIVTLGMGGESGYRRPGVAGSGTIALRGRRPRQPGLQGPRCWPAATPRPGGPRRPLRPRRASSTAATPDRIKVTTQTRGPRRLRPRRRGDRRGRGCQGRTADRARPKRARAPTSRRPPRRCSLDGLGDRSGLGHRFFGLHFFNPVTKMELVELCLPADVHEGVRERVHAWCDGARQDRHRGPRPGRLRRQPAAVPTACSTPCGWSRRPG